MTLRDELKSKTAKGCVGIVLAAILYAFGWASPHIERAGIALALVGLGMALYGIYDRQNAIWYQTDAKGRPDMRRQTKLWQTKSGHVTKARLGD